MPDRAPGSASLDALRKRIDRLDWPALEASLDERGLARTPRLLGARECNALIRLYDDEAAFRSRVDMQRHRFGIGEYRYFTEPLPPTVALLRQRLYRPLATIANRWRERLGERPPLPRSFEAFRALCHQNGQARPTPLLLRYERGGYNCLHQDLYGRIAFPLQVALLLSRPEVDFEGGEFLLVEQRARRQSRGSALRLERGQAVIFPNAERPVAGKRGLLRAGHRHGVSELHRGRRFALGIIFHDSR